MSDGVRLNKRVAEDLPCSRSEAEAYILGGWVSVDGVVVEEPGARVSDEQRIALLPGATAMPIAPVTIIVHKPAGVDASIGLIDPAQQEGKQRFLKHHLHKLELVAALDKSASGLLVFTQDYRVLRKFREDAPEQEIIVEVAGTISEGGLQQLNQGMKVSWQSETRLRFATKIAKPGLIERLCREVGLRVLAQKRIRIGRLPMASLAPARWRYLTPVERF